MKTNRILQWVVIYVTCLAAWGDAIAAEGRILLRNGLLTAEFEQGALVSLRDVQGGRSIEFTDDALAITVAGRTFRPAEMKRLDSGVTEHSLITAYSAGNTTVQVVHELKPGWHFISRHLVVTFPAGSSQRIDSVEVIRAELKTVALGEHLIGGGSRGVFLRFGKPGAAPSPGRSSPSRIRS